jgi:RNA polymerase sigma factor (TIGR02999 family)
VRDDELPSNNVTRLLQEWRSGHKEALDLLTPVVYAELRDIAARYLARERPDHTLQSTALVHEAYVRLVDQRNVDWQNRAHFFGVAAQIMRRILVDYARRRTRDKRGGHAEKVSLEGDVAADTGAPDVDVLAVDQALERLQQLDPDLCRIVELRFFGGLTIEETAEVVGSSSGTIKREWSAAKAWLYRELRADYGP